MAVERPIIICTRGSALALAQSNMIAVPRNIDPAVSDLDTMFISTTWTTCKASPLIT